MLSWIILIAVLIVLAVIGLLLIARFVAASGSGSVMDAPESAVDSQQRMELNRQAIADGATADIALDVVLHGYRQDQVDDLIAAYAQQVADLQDELSKQRAAQRTTQGATQNSTQDATQDATLDATQGAAQEGQLPELA